MKFSGERSFQVSAILCLVVGTLLQMTVTSAEDETVIPACIDPHARYFFYGRICSRCNDPLNCDAPAKSSGCYCEECYCLNRFGDCVPDQRCNKYHTG